MDTQHLEILLTLHLIEPNQQSGDNSNVLDKQNRTERPNSSTKCCNK